MSDTRTYIVPDGQENSTNQMLPWMAMMNGGMGGFGNGNVEQPVHVLSLDVDDALDETEVSLVKGNNCQNLQSAEIQGQLAGLREQMNTNQKYSVVNGRNQR